MLYYGKVFLRRISATRCLLFLPRYDSWRLFDTRREVERCLLLQGRVDPGARRILCGMMAARMKHAT